LSTLQAHYPERLGYSIINDIPLMLNMLLKFVLTFLDPITRAKCRLDSNVVEDKIFEPEGLMKEWWGGKIDFKYKHEKYWPALIQLTEERGRTWKERWRELGGTVGIREWLYKRPRVEASTSQRKAAASSTNSACNDAIAVVVDIGIDDSRDQKPQSSWVIIDGAG
jgi:hypothetical protein